MCYVMFALYLASWLCNTQKSFIKSATLFVYALRAKKSDSKNQWWSLNYALYTLLLKKIDCYDDVNFEWKISIIWKEITFIEKNHRLPAKLNTIFIHKTNLSTNNIYRYK